MAMYFTKNHLKEVVENIALVGDADSDLVRKYNTSSTGTVSKEDLMVLQDAKDLALVSIDKAMLAADAYITICKGADAC